jgi:quercetin dioxygenase-like cupin family protein
VPRIDEVDAMFRADGLTPHAWANAAGHTYARHSHEYHKVLICVRGTIVFHTDSADVALSPGDRLELRPGVGHAATVGDRGVECVEAYRT